MNVSDVVATVDKNKDNAAAPPEWQSGFRWNNFTNSPPVTPHNSQLNVFDITFSVDALKLVPYPYTIPSCP